MTHLDELIEAVEESECRQPCDPNVGCPECAGYWERMEREGYWDGKKLCWKE